MGAWRDDSAPCVLEEDPLPVSHPCTVAVWFWLRQAEQPSAGLPLKAPQEEHRFLKEKGPQGIEKGQGKSRASATLPGKEWELGLTGRQFRDIGASLSLDTPSHASGREREEAATGNCKHKPCTSDPQKARDVHRLGICPCTAAGSCQLGHVLAGQIVSISACEPQLCGASQWWGGLQDQIRGGGGMRLAHTPHR